MSPLVDSAAGRECAGCARPQACLLSQRVGAGTRVRAYCQREAMLGEDIDTMRSVHKLVKDKAEGVVVLSGFNNMPT
jgi:hypothetical protein